MDAGAKCCMNQDAAVPGFPSFESTALAAMWIPSSPFRSATVFTITVRTPSVYIPCLWFAATTTAVSDSAVALWPGATSGPQLYRKGGGGEGREGGFIVAVTVYKYQHPPISEV